MWRVCSVSWLARANSSSTRALADSVWSTIYKTDQMVLGDWGQSTHLFTHHHLLCSGLLVGYLFLKMMAKIKGKLTCLHITLYYVHRVLRYSITNNIYHPIVVNIFTVLFVFCSLLYNNIIYYYIFLHAWLITQAGSNVHGVVSSLPSPGLSSCAGLIAFPSRHRTPCDGLLNSPSWD